MSDNKNKVDGIKKLNKEELEKSRRVVLASIGEFSTEPIGGESAGKNIKRVDGLGVQKGKGGHPADISAGDNIDVKINRNLAEIKGGVKKVSGHPAVSTEHEKSDKTGMVKNKETGKLSMMDSVVAKREDLSAGLRGHGVSAGKRATGGGSEKRRKGGGIMNFIIRQSGFGKSEPRTNEPSKKIINKKESHREREKIERAKKIKEERRQKMRQRRKRIRRQKKIADKKARQAERKRRISELKLIVRKRIKIFWGRVKLAGRRSFFIFLFVFLLGLLLYSGILIGVLRFKIDNGFTRFVACHVPIPALITPLGTVDYYQYADFKRKFGPSAKTVIARKIILNNLAVRYNLPQQNLDTDDSEFKNKLAAKIVYDFNINQVAKKRINKIRQLIEKGDNFVRTANKYGDEQGQIDIDDKKSSDWLQYAPNIVNLEMGETSNIVITPTGYYIFKCFNRTDKCSGLSYVMVRAKTLDKYLASAVRNLKMWSLAD